ncbi:discoidin domain-containing protein [Cohnella hashimotonis]|uniref:Discoidin domain-containing protein n=1 Tax=Cohnella hashimotonis TaxID=2826895 RepID=A0ABT6TQL6_9BACL|nr:discoidin domain-containing protein [Cohnella hashimotonis]MDI4649136.1 discoidin domain-containing protein [Cohnella hashimotonis]
MTWRKALALLGIAALVWTMLAYPADSRAAESQKTAWLSAYEGDWVDEAFAEDEDIDGTLQVGVNPDDGTVRISYKAWLGETYTFESTAPIAAKEDRAVRWTYAYEDSDARGVYVHKGSGTVAFGSGKITLELDALPSELTALFIGKRTLIRDPYGDRTFTSAEAVAIATAACKCKPSAQVEVVIPDGDNEGNKNWIYYVWFIIRDNYRVEYKVNLHKRQAELVKSDWEYGSSLKVVKATASSKLPGSKTAFYGASNLVDKDPATCWCEGVKGLGVGQSVKLSFAEKTELSGVAIAPGYGKSVASYLDNGSVKKAKLVFSDGTVLLLDLTKKLNIFFDEKVKASSVKFVILDVTPGTKYADTCVSEIQFF